MPVHNCHKNSLIYLPVNTCKVNSQVQNNNFVVNQVYFILHVSHSFDGTVYFISNTKRINEYQQLFVFDGKKCEDKIICN